jgi:hypothetical protein
VLCSLHEIYCPVPDKRTWSVTPKNLRLAGSFAYRNPIVPRQAVARTSSLIGVSLIGCLTVFLDPIVCLFFPRKQALFTKYFPQIHLSNTSHRFNLKIVFIDGTRGLPIWFNIITVDSSQSAFPQTEQFFRMTGCCVDGRASHRIPTSGLFGDSMSAAARPKRWGVFR